MAGLRLFVCDFSCLSPEAGNSPSLKVFVGSENSWPGSPLKKGEYALYKNKTGDIPLGNPRLYYHS